MALKEAHWLCSLPCRTPPSSTGIAQETGGGEAQPHRLEDVDFIA
jgi:hypothetical protein